MRKTILPLAFSLLLCPLWAWGAEVVSPDVRVQHGEIVVTTGISLDERNLADLRNGISKEITFFVDLFRVWKAWPDEFIAGKKIVKTLRCNPIKKEYSATALEGSTLVEKRFKSFESMIAWALDIRDLKLINVKDLQQADYFVKVTVESRLRKLPPVLGYLLFFVPEKDFKISKDSPALLVGGEK